MPACWNGVLTLSLTKILRRRKHGKGDEQGETETDRVSDPQILGVRWWCVTCGELQLSSVKLKDCLTDSLTGASDLKAGEELEEIWRLVFSLPLSPHEAAAAAH